MKNGGIPPKREKCRRKMMLFQNALFLVKKFPEIVKNSICLLNFHQKFQNFLKNFQEIVFFVQTQDKLAHSLIIFFEKYAKIMHFSNFLKI